MVSTSYGIMLFTMLMLPFGSFAGTCEKDTGGSCMMMACSSSRGNAQCVRSGWSKHCTCSQSDCALYGKCVPAAEFKAEGGGPAQEQSWMPKVPSKCKGMIMAHPSTLWYLRSHDVRLKIEQCAMAKGKPFEEHLVEDASCSGPVMKKFKSGKMGLSPCGVPTCVAAVKKEAPKLVDDCLPEEDNPTLNPFCKCLLEHADDSCATGAMALSMPLAFLSGASDMALELATRQSTPGSHVPTNFATMWIAGLVAGMMIGTVLMLAVVRYRVSFGINVQLPTDIW